MIAQTPEPPYYAVIFSNVLTEQTEGYEEMAKQMVELAKQQVGFWDLNLYEWLRDNYFLLGV
ncbi:MAG: hypothetical protein R2769_09250 [Saprospiraceae bacterium]